MTPSCHTGQPLGLRFEFDSTTSIFQEALRAVSFFFYLGLKWDCSAQELRNQNEENKWTV